VSGQSKAVFLSYASEDSEAAQRICDALRAAGIEVWFDKSELRGGDAWDRRIREQIHDCRLFIPIISTHSEARDEGYFRREWALAADRTRDMSGKKAFVLPVVIDKTPERGAAVPDRFHDVQWTRLPAGETTPAFVMHVGRLLAQAPTATAPDEARASAPVAQRAFPRPRRLVIATITAAVGLVLAVGYLGLERFTLSKRATVAPVESAEKSIAVLPFADLSERKDQEYFADGIAEELLDMLAQIPGLKVIGRTSSFQFKGKNEDLRVVGRTLGVAHVVEGSVRRSGDQVRITAQLVRAADGAHEWSGTYDRDVQNVLQVQKELAASLARALEISVSSPSLAASGATTSSEAYDLYLRGRHAEDPETRQALTDAEAYFQRALEMDPNFAAAQEALVGLHNVQAANAFVIGQGGYPRVRDEATKLLTRHPNSLVGHALLCRYNLAYAWNWTEAERECGIALRINPRSPMAIYQAAELALALGHPAKAEQLFRAILSLDPLDSDTLVELSDTLLRQGRFAEAEAEARRALAATPSMYDGYYLLGLSLLAQARLEEALQAFQSESLEGGQQAGMAMAYYALGRKMEAASALKRFAENNGAGNSYVLAQTNAYMGDSDRALAWLETAFRDHEPGLQYVNGDWLLKPLESDPRYKAFLHKMNLLE
jgi:TolB-like protein/predicted Zn-dependent protease